MEKEEYRFGPDRILSVWIFHGAALLFVFIFGLTVLSGPFHMTSIGLSLFFLSIVFLPHTYLYYNHLEFERHTVVLITSSQILITKNNVSKSFNLEEILEVEEYEATKTPWTIIVKWKIIGKYDQETISSIVFPRTKAWQLFGTKINKKSSFMPIFP
jgi:hypothetical protein